MSRFCANAAKLKTSQFVPNYGAESEANGLVVHYSIYTGARICFVSDKTFATNLHLRSSTANTRLVSTIYHWNICKRQP